MTQWSETTLTGTTLLPAACCAPVQPAAEKAKKLLQALLEVEAAAGFNLALVLSFTCKNNVFMLYLAAHTYIKVITVLLVLRSSGPTGYPQKHRSYHKTSHSGFTFAGAHGEDGIVGMASRLVNLHAGKPSLAQPNKANEVSLAHPMSCTQEVGEVMHPYNNAYTNRATLAGLPLLVVSLYYPPIRDIF